MNNTLNLALKKVARNLSVELSLVEKVYKSYWCFIKEQAESVPIREQAQKELKADACNFNIPYLGKLYVDDKKIEKYKRQIKHNQNVKAERNKANGLSDSSN